jgi:glutamyl-Q tRNA(Asp) synthetase
LQKYADALEQLQEMGVVYPCFCSRKQVAQMAGELRPDQEEPIYPGVCRQLPRETAAHRIARGELPCWRLNASKASAMTGPLFWWDRNAGRLVVRPEEYGDVIIARRDMPTSYHLSVTVDDHPKRSLYQLAVFAGVRCTA